MYYQVTIPCSEESEDVLSTIVFEYGCSGCEYRAGSLIAFFPAEIDKAALRRTLEQRVAIVRQSGLAVPEQTLTVEEIPDRDWNAEWKKRFKPFQISPRFTIRPSWEAGGNVETKFVIEIDPKQAFGTGIHATTQLMMRMLESCLTTGMTVLDVGTGTAILAIAALKLGAAKAVAFDIDPVAVEAAIENRNVNLPGKSPTLFAGSLHSIKDRETFDLVLANITRNVILPMLPDLRSHLKTDGILLISGILIEEAEEVKIQLAAHGFLVRDEHHIGEWCGFIAERKSAS